LHTISFISVLNSFSILLSLGGIYEGYLLDLLNIGTLAQNFFFMDRDQALLELLTKSGELIKQVVTGCLMGDGSCAMSSSHSVNARFSFAQSIIHSGYLYFVFLILINFCTSIPRLQSTFDKRYNKVYSFLKFQTLALPIFTELRQLFYINGVKVVPVTIEALLSDVALAFWAQDDGYKEKSGFILCTDSFTKAECELLISVLYKKFGLICTLRQWRGKNQYRIYITAQSMDKFRSLVSPYFHSSMLYKLV